MFFFRGLRGGQISNIIEIEGGGRQGQPETIGREQIRKGGDGGGCTKVLGLQEGWSGWAPSNPRCTLIYTCVYVFVGGGEGWGFWSQEVPSMCWHPMHGARVQTLYGSSTVWSPNTTQSDPQPRIQNGAPGTLTLSTGFPVPKAPPEHTLCLLSENSHQMASEL